MKSLRSAPGSDEHLYPIGPEPGAFVVSGADARSAALAGRPVRPQTWANTWRMAACVPRLARLYARTRLGMMSWSGNQGAAVRITTEVVRNAVAHVDTGIVGLALSVDEHDVLLIDVTDPHSGHEGLDEALVGGDGTGLWFVRLLGGEVSWFPVECGHGKTIRVRMRPSSEIGCTATAAGVS
ncbi:hypothetical protein OHT57_02015 [Streptomyces sp. NBC_00285]|uniref:hypothetical protein n=1 Tax=Streptomyces sp. NBC_00285 TaxID=2975700 RepID=UPI002E2CDF21|nr:hypothetical protein [Streptomyces sp. NBC_00285]